MSSGRFFASAALLLSLGGTGCGGAETPAERDIWYTSSLRPGHVAPETQGERELLARMGQVPANEPVTFGGQTFVVDEPYFAASGRQCRSVTVRPTPEAERVEVKLACEDDTAWVFVPDVFQERARVAEAQP